MINDWYEIPEENFWAHSRNGFESGYTIAKLDPHFTGKTGYHIRHSPTNKDIKTCRSLKTAQKKVESLYIADYTTKVLGVKRV